MIYGIDPSVRCTGVAVLRESGELVDVYVVLAENVYEALDGIDFAHTSRVCVFVEVPRIYPKSKQKGDPNDLISCALVAGMWAVSARAQVKFVYPHTWKRQLTKTVCEERIRALLSPLELAKLDMCVSAIPRDLRNNAIDALGIALYGAGRFVP